jgi:hypothetical protein
MFNQDPISLHDEQDTTNKAEVKLKTEAPAPCSSSSSSSNHLSTMTSHGHPVRVRRIPSGKVSKYTVDLNHPQRVDKLKTLISADQGIPVSAIELLSIEELNSANFASATVYLQDLRECSMLIFVKTLTGKTISLDSDSSQRGLF